MGAARLRRQRLERLSRKPAGPLWVPNTAARSTLALFVKFAPVAVLQGLGPILHGNFG